MPYSATSLSETQTWRNQDERRYELEREVAERVLGLLDQHLPVMTYNDAPPTTLVATLYHDTQDGHYLRLAKTGGETSAVMIRAREYMPISDDQERKVLGHSEFCYLERKERTGTIRQKHRIKIAKAKLAGIMEHSLDLPGSCELLRDEVRARILSPVVISMYERRVWGRSDNLRITFDERIRYYRPNKRPFEKLEALNPKMLGAPFAVGPKRILEVKYAAADALPDWLSELVATLPEAVGFSKFIDGMSKMGGGGRGRPSLTRPVFTIP